MQSIKILGINYKIESVPQLNEPDILGISEETSSNISIVDYLNDVMYDDVLAHEVIHQVDERLKLGLTERQVQGLSTGLHCVYLENNMKLIFNAVK